MGRVTDTNGRPINLLDLPSNFSVLRDLTAADYYAPADSLLRAVVELPDNQADNVVAEFYRADGIGRFPSIFSIQESAAGYRVETLISPPRANVARIAYFRILENDIYGAWHLLGTSPAEMEETGLTPEQIASLLNIAENAQSIMDLAGRVTNLEANRATTTALGAEATARTEADATLQTNIDAKADQDALNTESNERVQADSNEATARQQGDANEASARSTADNTLTTADAAINALIVALTARVNANEVALANAADGGATFTVHSSFSSSTNYPFGDYLVDGQISYRVINPDGITGSTPTPTNSNYIVIYDGRTRTAAEITAEIQALVRDNIDFETAPSSTDEITAQAPSVRTVGLGFERVRTLITREEERVDGILNRETRSRELTIYNGSLNTRFDVGTHHSNPGVYLRNTVGTGLPSEISGNFRGIIWTFRPEESSNQREQILFGTLHGGVWMRSFSTSGGNLTPASWLRLSGTDAAAVAALIATALGAYTAPRRTDVRGSGSTGTELVNESAVRAAIEEAIQESGDGTTATIQARIWSNNVFASFTSQTNGQRTITLSADITAADSAVVWILGTVGSGADIVHTHWKFPAAALLAATANAPRKDGSVVIVQARASAARTIIITPEIIIPGEIADITPEQVFVINREVATAASGGGFAATQLFATSAAANYAASTPITLIAGENDITGATISAASSGNTRGQITLEPGMYLIECSAQTNDVLTSSGALGIQILNGSDILAQDIRQTDSAVTQEEPRTYNTPTAFRVFDVETTLTFQHYRDIAVVITDSEVSKTFSIAITRYEAASATASGETSQAQAPEGGEPFLNHDAIIPSGTVGFQQYEILDVVDVTEGTEDNHTFSGTYTLRRDVGSANNGNGQFIPAWRNIATAGNHQFTGEDILPSDIAHQFISGQGFERTLPITLNNTGIAPTSTTIGGFPIVAGRRYFILTAYGTNGSGTTYPQMIGQARANRFADDYRHPNGTYDVMRGLPWPQETDTLTSARNYFDGDRILDSEIYHTARLLIHNTAGNALAFADVDLIELQRHLKLDTSADINELGADTVMLTMVSATQECHASIGRNSSYQQRPRFTIGLNFFTDEDNPSAALGVVITDVVHTGGLLLTIRGIQ